MEQSQMTSGMTSEMSRVSSGVSETSQAGDATAKEQDDGKNKIVILIGGCVVVMLLLLLLFLGLGVFSSDSEDSDGNGPTNPSGYIANGGPAPTKAAPTTRTSTTATTTTTTEDSWSMTQNYSSDVFKDSTVFVCPFWSDKQGFKSHGRTYGIAYFPYQFCEAATYCCYALNDDMQLVSERPEVDEPPRDAVRRMAGFKAENQRLLTWLVLRGSDAVFHRLLRNASGEQGAFWKNTREWMTEYNYDGIRMWWPEAPAALAANLSELFELTNKVFEEDNRTFGFLVPNGDKYEETYNTSVLATLQVTFSLILHPTYPRNLTFIEAHSTHYKTNVGPYTVQEMRPYWYKHGERIKVLDAIYRKSLCSVMPLLGVTYTIKSSDCDPSKTDLDMRKIKPLGHGRAGPLTKTKGILSLPEVCDLVDASWQKRNLGDSAYDQMYTDSYLFACKDDQAIVYPNARTADDMRRKLTRSVLHGCYGLMSPEYDDFAGACKGRIDLGEDVYPITRGIFQQVV